MTLKKITTSITYKVSAWHYCNLQSNVKEMCRFCVKDGKSYRCAMYNMPLEMEAGALALKTRDCRKAVAGYKSIVEDVEEIDNGPEVDPKLLMKTTIEQYMKVRKQLLKQGYPEAIADKVAKDYMLGGK